MMSRPVQSFSLVVLAFAMALTGCDDERQWSTDSPEAVRLLAEGTALWQKFYYADAEAALKNAIGADSMFAAAWGRLALVHFYSGNHREAIQAITRAEQLAGESTLREQRFIRVWSYRIREQRDHERALLDSLIVDYPDNSELYLFRGNCYEMDRNYEAAVRTYAEGVKRDTGFALGVMSLGYAYSILGDQDNAVAYMQRYIRMAPQEADPRASYADILVRAGRYDEALEQYRTSLELKPDYWYSVREIGSVYAIQGRLRDAEQQFEESMRLLPQNVMKEAGLLRLRAYLDNQRGAHEDAVAQLRASLVIDSSFIGTGPGLSFALGKLKRFSEAWEVVDSVHGELVRRDMIASQMMLGYHLMRARLFLEEGTLDSAEAACREAVEVSTPFTRGAVYVHLARVFVARRDWESALDALDGALSVNPNAPEALLLLVRVYHGRGDKQMTVEIGNRLLHLWRNADSDFRFLRELRALLPATHPS